MRWLLLFSLILSSGAIASDPPASEQSPETLKFTPLELYKFNLGGESGQYTDWEKLQIHKFDGLSTTIEIKEVKGKPKDKWASIARISMYGEGDEKSRGILSLTFKADRKTGKIEADLWRGGDTPHHPIDVDLVVGKPIQLFVLVTATDEFTLQIDDFTSTIESKFEVKAIRVIGSGVDVTFSPFNLLGKSIAQ
jgi:hypothetical protein